MFFLATKIAEQFSLNRLRRAPMHLRSQALAFGPWESYPKRKLYGYGLCKGGAPPPKKPKIRVSTGKPSIFGTSNFWCWVVSIRMLKWHATELRRIHKRTDLLLRCDRCCPRYAQVLNSGCWYFVVPSGDSLWRTRTWSDHSKYQVQRLLHKGARQWFYCFNESTWERWRWNPFGIVNRASIFFKVNPLKKRPNFQSKEGAPFGFQSNDWGNAVDSALQRCPDWFSIVRVRLLDGWSFKIWRYFFEGKKTNLLEMDFPHEWVATI